MFAFRYLKNLRWFGESAAAEQAPKRRSRPSSATEENLDGVPLAVFQSTLADFLDSSAVCGLAATSPKWKGVHT